MLSVKALIKVLKARATTRPTAMMIKSPCVSPIVFAMLSVASRSGGASEVAAYVREHGIVPRVVLDQDGSLAARFGVGAYPTTFVVDAGGEIQHAEVGYTTELGLRARVWLAEHL